MAEDKKYGGPNDHLANERTFLAWIRTSVGIMAFGFVVVKFSLFVKQISLVMGDKNIEKHPHSYSGAVGIFLVVVGTVTCGLAYLSYKRTEKQLREGRYNHSSVMTSLLAGFILLISILVIIYLIRST